MVDDAGSLILQADSMTEHAFVTAFGAVYEHSPWIARRTWRKGIDSSHTSPSRLAAAFAATLEEAGSEEQLQLILAHPDLAGKAAISGELTAESSGEQASAGIDRCTAEEFSRFQRLNRAYKEKFRFPFIMAVRGSNKTAILQAFEQRLHNDAETEFARALTEINRIAQLRLEAM